MYVEEIGMRVWVDQIHSAQKRDQRRTLNTLQKRAFRRHENLNLTHLLQYGSRFHKKTDVYFAHPHMKYSVLTYVCV
jgi:hypothetical protein